MNKAKIYQETHKKILSTIEGENNFNAVMATISCLLNEAFLDRFIWCGFYVRDFHKDSELVVGPYQGTLGCLRIPFGKGVCGAAAQSRQTQVVKDVHTFPGHIACDSNTNSEIVVPVFNNNLRLIAVLDIDSAHKAEFDETDKKHLEKLVNEIFSQREWS